jgi:hypothetical protein
LKSPNGNTGTPNTKPQKQEWVAKPIKGLQRPFHNILKETPARHNYAGTEPKEEFYKRGRVLAPAIIFITR